MAMDPDKLTSPKTRSILVTDVEWRFDFDLRDAVTLREGDTIDTQSEPGWVVITHQPLVPGGFPEVIRHQVCKIISERHQMRRMEVPITPAPAGSSGGTGGASTAEPADPAPVTTGASPLVAPTIPAPHPPSPTGSPAPRPRRPRRTRSVPAPTGTPE